MYKDFIAVVIKELEIFILPVKDVKDLIIHSDILISRSTTYLQIVLLIKYKRSENYIWC